jgi:hypothetical protein
MSSDRSSTDRIFAIDSWDFDVPENYFPIPLDGDVDARDWVKEVVASARELPSEVAPEDRDRGTVLTEQLTSVRDRLIARRNPWLTAVVSVRPETPMTVGVLVMAQQLALEDDDDADSMEVLGREASARMVPGARSRDLETWRTQADFGEIVGLYQRIEFIDLGEAEGTLSERTVFTVFPTRSREALQFTFTTEDFGTFEDMKKQTEAIVSTLRIDLEPVASDQVTR